MSTHRRFPSAAFLFAASAFALVLALAAPLGEAAAAEDDGPSASALRAQVLLARARFSPGLIDGRWGHNTESALRAYQRARGLEVGGRLDEATRRKLEQEVGVPVMATYEIASDVVEGPYLESIPDDLTAQSRLERLGYTSAMEQLGERLRSSPDLLRRLNPEARFEAGETIRVPAIPPARPSGEVPDPATLTIQVSSSETALRVLDRDGEVVFWSPATAGSEAQPLPFGEWEVVGISSMPTFHYDPALFADAAESDEKVEIAAGPNNPVGVVWIDLSVEHYGIHGTPEPSEIGYSASHGCVRLTNWDAAYLSRLVGPGTPVQIED